jgi:hypothetical protein
MSQDWNSYEISPSTKRGNLGQPKSTLTNGETKKSLPCLAIKTCGLGHGYHINLASCHLHYPNLMRMCMFDMFCLCLYMCITLSKPYQDYHNLSNPFALLASSSLLMCHTHVEEWLYMELVCDTDSFAVIFVRFRLWLVFSNASYSHSSNLNVR